MTENAFSILIVIFSVQLQQTKTSDRKLFIFQHSNILCVCKYLYMLSATFHDRGNGADDPDLPVTLTRTTATLSSPDLLYIIHGNGYFSQAVGDTSFSIWVPIVKELRSD